ncbi:MAG: tryptophan synthase subunit alpha [Candidatus Pacebacteria bacterium CG_4_10_14_3_um_filter_34_15]|nr:MAG: tryptophan synthase subunit alpha [Candidatus Pacebacteria bacterium CG11_big_fil_rev_8_21_14_0_20_34_55]PIX81766.1 MAG: tryptophan synthase subunit alpha [Candidatus Pacebacteria bacterium CG_4_10_14_3_um_filter_34_15]PJC43465.1 MAG: tryptophan synthase subunit alpha [Candidatus Pacebacteria bacterium CG_4_9_14_0_2_um_filter_34_50]
MTKLEEKLQQIKKEERVGLMTHVVIGYPTLEETISIAKTMAENGVDIIELQIPFSDPLADGPTIMHACEKSLENGTKVKDAFIIMRQLTSQIPTPLLFMAYYNTVFKYGVEKFCKNAQAAGASGLIVPDMPIDEESEEHFLFFCRKYDLHNIQVISPASTEDRLKKNAEVASGFVYCTARQGITGAKDQLDQNITTYIEKVKSFFSVPVAIGFGISKRQHIQALKPHADIAVIGSAIINIINKSNESDTKQKIKQFLLELKS